MQGARCGQACQALGIYLIGGEKLQAVEVAERAGPLEAGTAGQLATENIGLVAEGRSEPR